MSSQNTQPGTSVSNTSASSAQNDELLRLHPLPHRDVVGPLRCDQPRHGRLVGEVAQQVGCVRRQLVGVGRVPGVGHQRARPLADKRLQVRVRAHDGIRWVF